HMFLADIVAVEVDEKLLDTSGKLRLDRCNLLAFAHGDYYTLGEKLGSFGYSVRKKPTKAKKKKSSKT
ncbi:MAG: flavin reductase family protein, partial [Angelakisella sp.]